MRIQKINGEDDIQRKICQDFIFNIAYLFVNIIPIFHISLFYMKEYKEKKLFMNLCFFLELFTVI